MGCLTAEGVGGCFYGDLRIAITCLSLSALWTVALLSDSFLQQQKACLGAGVGAVGEGARARKTRLSTGEGVVDQSVSSKADLLLRTPRTGSF